MRAVTATSGAQLTREKNSRINICACAPSFFHVYRSIVCGIAHSEVAAWTMDLRDTPQ